jgi:hypothetical protein
MRAEFHWDAKSGSRPRLYQAAARPLADPAPDSLQQLWAELKMRSDRDNPQQAGFDEFAG